MIIGLQNLIKNYNIKKFIVIFVVLLISSIGLIEFNCLVNSTNGGDYPVDHMVVQYNGLAKELAEKENRTLCFQGECTCAVG